MKRSNITRRFSSIENLENRQLLTVSGFELPPFDSVAPAEVSSDDAQQGDRVQRIVNGTQTSDYDSVGIVNGQCSGTLIAPNAVLTAAHCIPENTNEPQDFEVNGRRYQAASVHVHPDYNSRDIDLAVMILRENVAGIDPVDINRVAPQVGQMLTLVGFGATGTPQAGHDGSFGVKHVGQTPIDEVTPTEVNWRFDNANEANTAPGDSGGAAFLEVNGQLVLAGVTSGGTQENAGLGDYSFDVRVDAFASWIDGIVQAGGVGTDPTDGDNPGEDVTDPGTDPPTEDPDEIFDDIDDDFEDDFDDGGDAEQFAIAELEDYDTNGDGKLSRRELVNEFLDYGDTRSEARELADYLLDSFDEDGDRKLDLAELTASYGGGEVVDDDDIGFDGDFEDGFDDTDDGSDDGDIWSDDPWSDNDWQDGEDGGELSGEEDDFWWNGEDTEDSDVDEAFAGFDNWLWF